MNRYLVWLISKVGGINRISDPYLEVITRLFNTQFMWSCPMDKNRAEDGLMLRYVFSQEQETDSEIEYIFSNTGCNMLEMMIALALRIENDYLAREGNIVYTDKWFFNMIYSLGFRNPNKWIFSDIMRRFFNHEYTREGDGGLFYIPNLDYSIDLRKEEIWVQMNHWVSYADQRREIFE